MRYALTIVGAAALCVACSASDMRRRSMGNVSERQSDRIEAGRDDGSLTPGEARRLREQQQDIREDRRDARDGGVVTPKERREIRREQNDASKDIYDARHDDQED